MRLRNLVIASFLIVGSIVPAMADGKGELKLFLHAKGQSDFYGLGDCETYMDQRDSDDPEYCEGSFINADSSVGSSFDWRGDSVSLDASRPISGVIAIKTTRAVTVAATVEVIGEVGGRAVLLGKGEAILDEQELGVYPLDLSLDVPSKLHGKRLTSVMVSVEYSGTWVGGHVGLDDPASFISLPIFGR